MVNCPAGQGCWLYSDGAFCWWATAPAEQFLVRVVVVGGTAVLGVCTGGGSAPHPGEGGAQVEWGQDDAGVPARRTGLSNEEKDRLRTEFGQRLRELLELAGLSSRAFAQRYPAYRDSTIRKYTSGKNLPPWDFLRDVLGEVGRTTADAAGEQRAAELYGAYRTMLVRFGADVRGSDQNSLLLRLYDGEQILAELNRDIELLREGGTRLLVQLEEARAGGDSGRTRELELQGEELVGRREALFSRRTDLVGDLERCRALIRLREARGPADPRDSGMPGVPRPWLLAGAVAAVALLVATAFAVGAWSREDPDETASPEVATSPTRTLPSPSLPQEREEAESRRKAAAWPCPTCHRQVFPDDDGETRPPGSECTDCTSTGINKREREAAEELAAEESAAREEAKKNGLFGFLR
ncbi:hypothetical protein [Streptomyces sp. 058-1L]|uniref:hypothetical protein n=1 Tax=Streptomyces sp. 058-1L TaxID=2789266 RepID=UPI00397F7C28